MKVRTLLPLCLVVCILLPGKDIADVRKGEMFGYQVGAIYPCSPKVIFSASAILRIFINRTLRPTLRNYLCLHV
jgi:hypothetical protein